PVVGATPATSMPAPRLAAGCHDGDPQILLATPDELTWTPVTGFALPSTLDSISALAIGPTSDFRAYYVGYRGRAGVDPAGIWSTPDAGANWFKNATGVLDLSPNGIAVDPRPARQSQTAYVALGGLAGGQGS